jgi:hypothetical protein
VKPVSLPLATQDPDHEDRAVRVADALADALMHGPRAAVATARGFSDRDLRLGLDFIASVLEVASSSARAITTVLRERTAGSARPPLH